MADNIQIISRNMPNDVITLRHADGTVLTIYIPITADLSNVTIEADKKEYDSGLIVYYVKIYDSNGYLIKEENFYKEKLVK